MRPDDWLTMADGSDRGAQAGLAEPAAAAARSRVAGSWSSPARGWPGPVALVPARVVAGLVAEAPVARVGWAAGPGWAMPVWVERERVVAVWPGTRPAERVDQTAVPLHSFEPVHLNRPTGS